MRAASFPAFFLFFPFPPLSLFLFLFFFFSVFNHRTRAGTILVSRSSRAYARDVLSACSAPLEKLPGPSNSASLRRNRENQFTGDSRQAGLIGTVTGKSDTHWVAFFVRKRIGRSLSLSLFLSISIVVVAATGVEKFRPRRIGASVAARDTKVAPLSFDSVFHSSPRKPRESLVKSVSRSRGNAQSSLFHLPVTSATSRRSTKLFITQRCNWPGEKPVDRLFGNEKDKIVTLHARCCTFVFYARDCFTIVVNYEMKKTRFARGSNPLRRDKGEKIWNGSNAFSNLYEIL